MQSTVAFRTSPQQRRLWRLERQQRDSGSPFRARALVRISGPLDDERLSALLHKVVEENEILRTTLSELPGMTESLQQVHATARLRIDWHDLSRLSATERERRVHSLFDAVRDLPGTVDTGSPLHVACLRLAPGESLLLLSLPAACADARSLHNLVGQLGRLAAGDGGAQPVQYADIAEVLNDLLESDDARQGRRFWQGQNGAPIARIRLPFEPELAAEPALRPRRRPVELSADTVERLEGLAESLDASLDAVLLAAWQILLWRFTGRLEVTVGMLFDGRSYAELVEALGPLARVLPVRPELAPAESFAAQVGRSAAALAEAALWQEFFTWDRFAAEAARTGDDFFPFCCEILDAAPVAAGHVAWEVERLDVCLEPFKAKLKALRRSGGLELELQWDPRWITDDLARRMAEGAAALLAAVARTPDLQVGDLEAHGATDRTELIEAFNRTVAELPWQPLHVPFERRAEEAPEHLALSAEGVSWSYGELDAAANRLARYLRCQGVGRGSLVAVCLERSPEMVMTLLAVLKAGAAYLPIDPGYPADRREHMLADARPAVVVARGGQELPADGAFRLVRLDADAAAIAAEPAGRIEGGATLDDLAYVIYTSGSTGRPKGVMVSHRSIANRLLWLQTELPLGCEDRLLQKTPFSFDASIWEIFLPLWTGAELVLARPGGQQDTAYLAEVLAERKVTVVQLVPSLLRVLLDEPALLACKALRRVFCGGEALPGELQERCFARLPWAELVNTYGPTEAAIDVTCHVCAPGAPAAAVPIGRPIANNRVHLTDPRLVPLPLGAPGELVVGGINLAWGYLGRPDLTAERFVPDPFGAAPGARLYRTGDLARRWPDGTLEYMGRVDRQVKIRGFRIEPGEIEAALAVHPALREVAVAPWQDEMGTRLAAYFVAGGKPPAVGELRSFLLLSLPEHMVPSAFVRLPALPRTPSGKLDRERLPAPDTARPELEREYVAPATPAERILAAVWSEVLGLDRVGVHDNFFELGGDSIRSIQVLSRAAERGLRFTVRQLFEHRTIRTLAHHLSEGERPEAAGGALTGPFSLVDAADRARMPEGVEDAYPLAMMQAGMFFHSAATDQALYHEILSSHLQVPLDMPALQAAVAGLLERHPILRTSFHFSGFSEPLQLVHRQVELPLWIIDLTALPEPVQEAEVAAWIEREKRRSFEWTVAPLLRMHVHLRSGGTIQVSASEHHAISDGWSMAVMLTDLFHLYMARLGRAGAIEPPPATPYRDFVALERQTLASEESRSFWREQLDGAPFTRMPRWPEAFLPAGRTGLLETAQDLSPELCAGLEELARDLGVPLKTLLLAAHLRVLALQSGQTDLVTGVVSNGRVETADGERVVGLFVNTLPLRAQLPGGSWQDLILRTFEIERDLLQHRRFPIAELQRMADGRSLFEITFNYVHFHVYERMREMGGAEELGTYVFEQTNFPLQITFNKVWDQISLTLRGDARELAPQQMRSVADALHGILTAMVADPAVRYELADLLSGREKEHLSACQGRRLDAGPEQRLHGLFERQAERTPGRTAVSGGAASWSYAELEEKANRLARHLRRRGAGRGSRVAVCLERSPEMVMSLLAVLKAGAAWVPLDPDYPGERLAAMLADAQPAAVIVDGGRAVPGLERRRLVRLDEDTAAIARESGERCESGSTPDDLAYVIYTSGSTGRPKGVLVSHRSIANRLLWLQAELPLNTEDRLLQKTPYSFDASIWEIFLPLWTGAELVLARPRGQQDAAYMVEVMARQGVTVVQLVPSMLRVLLDEPGLSECRALRRVFCGGEALPGELQERFFARLPQVELVNTYGPTEAAIDVTWHVCAPGTPAAATPIGRPIANTRIRLADPRLMPLPPGAPGELLIEGVNLAWGYLGRPDLTAERFVPDPFGETPGARLYRTGDLARSWPDGTLEYLGRADQQVKIRGYRIEPGEVEAVLAGYPGVREAAVLVREDGAGERCLVGYASLAPGAAAGPAYLRGFLERQLPSYMVPAWILLLPELPRTPSGKLDRAALPAPEPRAEEEAAKTRPRTLLEGLIAEVWSDVLGVSTIGVDEPFFELGGHSLIAIRIAARLRALTGVSVPLRDMLETTTVATLAGRIEQRLRKSDLPAAPPLAPAPRDGGLPLSYAQERLWFLDQLEPGSPLNNVPLVLRLAGPLSVAALRQTLEACVARHESLRTRFNAGASGAPVQIIDPPPCVPLPVIDLAGLPAELREAEARRQSTAELLRPFDLAAGSPARFRVLRMAAQDHAVLLTVHHIVSDGWSTEVLVEEVSTLYRAWSTGRPAELPELPVQYADFARWQRSWLTGAALDAQVDYWREALRGAPPVSELPLDRPRGAVQSRRGAARSIAVGPDVAQALRQLGRQEGATPFMTCFAAFAALLHRYTSAEDLVIGTPVANRDRAEVERVIGLFVNTLVLRADLSGAPRFSELIARVRAASLGAYTHQDLPFEKLVEELAPVRSFSHTPLFQTVFTLQSTPWKTVDVPGLAFREVEVDSSTAKFDLTLMLADGPEGLAATLRYNTGLFDGPTIARLLESFRLLLAGVAADPACPVADLPLQPEALRHQVLCEWNDAGRPLAAECCLHERFAEQAALHPEAVAVVAGDRRLSWGELEGRSNRLARHLLAAGFGPCQVAGLLMESSAETIVAVLAVHKAGGAYLGLDPELPDPRLAAMLEDSGTAVVLTCGPWRGRLAGAGARRIVLEEAAAEIAARSARPLPRLAVPESLAYVVYTSGSTGRPKGVGVEHRQVAAYLDGILEKLAFQPGDSVAMLQPLAVDAPVTYLFTALCHGGVLHVVPRPMLLDPPALGACLTAEAIDHLKIAPTLLATLLESPRPQDLLPRKTVLVGGEGFPAELAERIRALAPGCAAVNHYGPTETTVGVLTWRAAADGAAGNVLPLGRPLEHAKAWVVDAGLRTLGTVPLGAAGEIAIGGRTVSRGYLGRPDLTAARFRPDPWSGEPGARLYLTGDLGRHRPDGLLEFLGRIDHQVKVRGFRVELEEIEAALMQNPSVQAAAVALRSGPEGEQLAAYVVASGSDAPGAAELVRSLRGELPAYMVPSTVTFLESLPRTPQGKIDRKALPAPEVARLEEHPYEAPRSATEKVVAGLWAEMLGLDRVGMRDNFFSLGGHSLLAVRLYARLRETFRREIPLRLLFEASSLEGFVAALVASETTPGQTEKLAGLLLRVWSLSPEQINALLGEKRRDRGE